MKARAQYLTLHEVLLVVCVLVGLGILLSMLAPVARERLRRRACERNLRSIGLSMLMYSGDYGGFFPNLNPPGLGAELPDPHGNWQPLGRLQYHNDNDARVWECPSSSRPKSDADCSNYRYIGSGYKDDNDHATFITLGYDASGNHPGNRWMNALFIDGHTEGRRPDGRGVITYNIPGGQKTSYWNRNDW